MNKSYSTEVGDAIINLIEIEIDLAKNIRINLSRFEGEAEQEITANFANAYYCQPEQNLQGAVVFDIEEVSPANISLYFPKFSKEQSKKISDIINEHQTKCFMLSFSTNHENTLILAKGITISYQR